MSSQQPQMTPSRCFVRLRDRLELVLDRYVDGDPNAQADFAAYKADRDGRWALQDVKKKEGSNIPAPNKSQLVKTPAKTHQCLQKKRNDTPTSGPRRVANAEDARDERSGTGTQVFPGFDFELGGENPRTHGTRRKDGSDCPRSVQDGSGTAVERRHTNESRQRNVLRSSTFSDVVSATLSESRRRKRKRSDAKPGYFNPDSFGNRASSTAVRKDEGDELVMNIPVEMETRP